MLSSSTVGRAAPVLIPLLGLAVLALLGLARMGFLGGSEDRLARTVEITVPGAMNLAVHCGGEETHFANGEEIRFDPEGPRCDIEAPLSPVMPVRGQIVLGSATRYRCRRRAMELECAAE